MNKKHKIMIVLLIFCVSLLGACMYDAEKDNENIYTGTVECDETNISSEIAGMITEMRVKEGDSVKKEDVIACIDIEGLKYELAQAQAGLKIAQSNLKKLQSGARNEEIKKARAQVEQLETILEGKNKDYQYQLDRYNDLKKLYEASAVSEQKIEDVKAFVDASYTAMQSTKKEMEGAKYQLDLLEKGVRSEEIQMAEGEVEKAQAMVEGIRHKISKQNIVTPTEGIVQAMNYQEGEFVPMYGTIANILDLKNLWIKIYIPEKKLDKVSLGEEVKITADFLENRSLRGEIVFVASEAEFTPKNVESKENKQEMVFAVKIKVNERIAQLKPGMLVDIKLGGEKK